ncbi:MAG: nucleotidyltransferase family protein [Dehalococcoidia bacterium]
MSIDSSLQISRERIAELCRTRGIRRLAVFGSALRADFRPDSDVDVLVEFEPGRTPGFAFFDVQDELSALFGRRVDLNTPGFLSERIRDRVRAEAEVLFAGD